MAIVTLRVDMTIPKGKLKEFQRIAQQMIAASRKEPGTLGYQWFLSADGGRCRIVETYANSQAVLAHLAGPVITEFFPKLMGQSKIDAFEVYGKPSPKAAAKLKGSGAVIFGTWRGFSR